ncbi:unnamed protein product [Schistosoma mattheei]|uniref:Uncharacterized protein n=1 Tax=Schistosoma mattheei TaxID=31246 RepID=A0A183NRE8_9TREM|nr:unnamed protein product [Schistosoma mattheei]
MTKGGVENVNIGAYFFTIIEKEAYSSLKTLALPEKPIWIPYATLKELLLDYVKYTNFKCSKGEKSRKTIHRDIENSTTLLRCPNASRTQGYADNSLRSCDADMVCPNDSHIYDKISYKSEENMLSESNHDQKSNAVLIDADFSSDSLFFDKIPNKSEENISE